MSQIDSLRMNLLTGPARQQQSVLRQLKSRPSRLREVMAGFEINSWGTVLGPPGFRLSPVDYSILPALRPQDRYQVPWTDAFASALIEGAGRNWLQTMKLDRLTHLRIQANQLTSLAPLRKLTTLEHLSIAEAHNVTDYDPLAALTELSSLRIQNTTHFNLEVMSNTEHLEKLMLVNVGDFDVELLNHLYELEILLVQNQPALDSLDYISELQRLNQLRLTGCGVQEIDQIGEFRMLDQLSLRNCPIDDFSPLSDLHQLTTLHLSGQEKDLELPDLPGDELREFALYEFPQLEYCPHIEKQATLRAASFLDCPNLGVPEGLFDAPRLRRINLRNVGFTIEDFPEDMRRFCKWK